MKDQRRPYYSATKNLSSVVDKVAKPHLQKGGYALATVILDWEKIVGPYIAKLTKPKKITFPKGAKNPGVLNLQVEPAASLMMGFQKGIILEKIRAYYGKQIVFDVMFEQFPISNLHKSVIQRPKKKHPLPVSIKESIDSISDDRLKESLLNLAELID
ncbi:MAG: hypothetical protein HEEMFOPI_00167 [Holosporales bacterium]